MTVPANPDAGPVVSTVVIAPSESSGTEPESPLSNEAVALAAGMTLQAAATAADAATEATETVAEATIDLSAIAVQMQTAATEMTLAAAAFAQTAADLLAEPEAPPEPIPEPAAEVHQPPAKKQRTGLAAILLGK